jgi:multiple sugar transport system substrate-binding protein
MGANKVLFLLAFVCSCFAGSELALGQTKMTFWTTEVEKDRLNTQRRLAVEFERKTTISVKIIPVQENLLAERVTAAYAARSLPDAIFHPIDFAIGWVEAGILDPAAAAAVIAELGAATFAKGPLRLARVGGGYAGVPIDGWGQLLLYRKDLFAAKELKVPDTWDRIRHAAKALHGPPSVWGMAVATDPGQVYTQQVFEHFALSNGVRLAGPSGRISLNTPALIETLDFYRELAGYTPPGNIDWLRTRMAYLSGRAAMIIWSPFILDELTGLRRDQPVIPDVIRKEPGFLARNTGFVGAVHGPKGLAQYGQINYLGITRDADVAAAKAWAAFLLSEGYGSWLGMAAEGKLPMRRGTAEAPDRFVEEWSQLRLGVTGGVRISQFYGDDVVAQIVAGMDRVDRWGFGAGQGALVTKVYGLKVIPEILKRFLEGRLSAEEAARKMEERVTALGVGD